MYPTRKEEKKQKQPDMYGNNKSRTSSREIWSTCTIDEKSPGSAHIAEGLLTSEVEDQRLVSSRQSHKRGWKP
jgi:hypothetical protein